MSYSYFEALIRVCEEAFCLAPGTMMRLKTRRRQYSVARFALTAFLRSQHGLQYERIASLMGGVEHGTIIYRCAAHEREFSMCGKYRLQFTQFIREAVKLRARCGKEAA